MGIRRYVGRTETTYHCRSCGGLVATAQGRDTLQGPPPAGLRISVHADHECGRRANPLHVSIERACHGFGRQFDTQESHARWVLVRLYHDGRGSEPVYLT